MRSASQWLDLFKRYKPIYSDYSLARHWGVSTSHISQYRKGRLKLPLAFILEIAETCNRQPLEIIITLNYHKARERDKEGLKDVYFEVAKEGICNEMAANAGRGWRPKRRYYK